MDTFDAGESSVMVDLTNYLPQRRDVGGSNASVSAAAKVGRLRA